MSITKDYFYCLSTDELELEKDYIFDFSKGNFKLNNVNISHITVEVQDVKTNSTGTVTAIYNTDAIGGTTTTTTNHWQTLAIVNYIAKDNTVVSYPVIGVQNLYNPGDCYTKISDLEEVKTTTSILNGVTAGIKSNYNFIDIKEAKDNTYTIDFYLFLHVNGKIHSDSTVPVPNRSELAISKVSKEIKIIQEISADIKIGTTSNLSTLKSFYSDTNKVLNDV